MNSAVSLDRFALSLTALILYHIPRRMSTPFSTFFLIHHICFIFLSFMTFECTNATDSDNSRKISQKLFILKCFSAIIYFERNRYELLIYCKTSHRARHRLRVKRRRRAHLTFQRQTAVMVPREPRPEPSTRDNESRRTPRRRYPSPIYNRARVVHGRQIFRSPRTCLFPSPTQSISPRRR